MENAGLVTFNDIYCYKEDVTQANLSWLCIVITHELSHHWFGNLVTMKWWNDLWLNESFADFIAHYCLSKINLTTVNIADAYLLLNMRKAWGYREDQLPTTHPIATEVKNTEVAENIFDGITYSKGAAVIR
jgi:aminopeptidase N